MTLSITKLDHYADFHILYVVMVSVITLNAVMLNVIMLNVVVLNVIMLSVVAPKIWGWVSKTMS